MHRNVDMSAAFMSIHVFSDLVVHKETGLVHTRCTGSNTEDTGKYFPLKPTSRWPALALCYKIF